MLEWTKQAPIIGTNDSEKFIAMDLGATVYTVTRLNFFSLYPIRSYFGETIKRRTL